MYILLYDPTPYDAVPFELYVLTLKYFDNLAIMSCIDTRLPPSYLICVNLRNVSDCIQKERFKSFCCFQYSAESSLSIKLCSTMSASNYLPFKQLMRLAYMTCKAKMYLYTLCYAILSASSYVLFNFLMLVSLGNYSLCGFFSVGIREWPTKCELFGHDQHNANELPISQTHLYIYYFKKYFKCKYTVYF